MKLKTLKDIMNIDPTSDHYECVEHDDLKQEAIKWIKHYQKIIDERNKPIYWDGEAITQIKTWNNEDCKIEFIMEFFNITDEDLK